MIGNGRMVRQELPDELQRIRERGGGTNSEGKKEWEVNLAIVEKVAFLLRNQGMDCPHKRTFSVFINTQLLPRNDVRRPGLVNKV